jgi:hypothetical protein
MRTGLLLVIALGVVFCGPTWAQEPRYGPLQNAGTWCRGCAPVPKCCPDYQRKPFPWFPCPVPRGCNDYDRKPFPWFPCPVPRGCNDYGRKPCPECTPGPCEPGRCISAGCPCPPSSMRAADH